MLFRNQKQERNGENSPLRDVESFCNKSIHNKHTCAHEVHELMKKERY